MSKSAKQRREEYKNGVPGNTHGIWNSITKRFVYGIRESSLMLADKKLREVNPKGSYCWRYTAKHIPAGWKNPPNQINY